MSNIVNRYPNFRRRHQPETRAVDGEELIVLRGRIDCLETKGVSFGRNTRSHEWQYVHKDELINGMPRKDSVVVYVYPSQDTEYFGIHCREEIWNSQWDTAMEVYGEFAQGDMVEILINDAGVPVSIAKLEA